MAAKYKKIDPRVWKDERFRRLADLEKLIALYVVTAQSNRVGLFNFSVALAAEDLGMTIETFAKRFGNVCQTLHWAFDEGSRTMYLPSWFKYNPPENENVLKSCMGDLDDLPQTPLATMFFANLRYLPDTLHQTFRERYPKHLANHEHEHEHEQEHKTAAAPPGVSPAKTTSDKTLKATEPEFPPSLETPRFRSAWAAWEKHRIEIKKKLTPSTRAAQLKQCASIGEDRAVKMIEHTIFKGWIGLREDDEPATKRGKAGADIAATVAKGLNGMPAGGGAR